jgi:ADP-ribose pyrophosphatase YjhB (NUDIX family)
LVQREFPSSPLVGVGAVIVDERGRVLLIKRGTEPRKGHWSIPGGLLNLGETLADGVRREISEETGLSVKPEAVVEVVDRIYTNDGAESEPAPVRYHYVVVDYWCSVLAGKARPASDAADLVWASRDEWLEPPESSRYALEAITVQVIEKGWQMALRAGIHG